MAVAHHFITATDTGIQKLWRVRVQSRIQNGCRRQIQRIKKFKTTPSTHTVAVFPPRKVQHIRLRGRRPQARAQTLTKSKMFQVESEINRQPCAARPAVIRTGMNCAVVKPSVTC